MKLSIMYFFNEILSMRLSANSIKNGGIGSKGRLFLEKRPRPMVEKPD